MTLPTLAIDIIMACDDLDVLMKLITPASHNPTLLGCGWMSHDILTQSRTQSAKLIRRCGQRGRHQLQMQACELKRQEATALPQ